MTRTFALSCLSAVLLSACSHTQLLTEREQMQLDLRYRGNRFELAQSLWVAPFFRDDSRRLLSREPPNEEILLVNPRGEPILPGDALAVLPAGTKVTVLRFTFPSGWSYAFRPLLTPRDRPWLEMAIATPDPAYVLVFPPDMRSEEDAFEKVGQLITDKPIDQEVAALPPADRQVIATKQLATGVSARALELAFGAPNFRRIHGEATSRLEDWTWYSDMMARTAHLKDGVVVSFEQKKSAPADRAGSAQ